MRRHYEKLEGDDHLRSSRRKADHTRFARTGDQAIMNDTFHATPGPYMVRRTDSAIPGHLTVYRAKTLETVAVIPPKEDGQPNWADAAAFAATPNAMEALVEIQCRL